MFFVCLFLFLFVVTIVKKEKAFSKPELVPHLPICNSSCVTFPSIFPAMSLLISKTAYEISKLVLSLNKEPTSYLFPTKLSEGRTSQSRLIIT